MHTTVGGEGLTPSGARGRTIGPYLLEAELGRGGMGVVYRARHPEVDRPLALKLLRTRGALAPRVLERFQREGEALARLRHPGVVAVHSAGEAEEGRYLVTELVEGEPLDALMERRPRPPDEEVARIGRELADALAAAHAAGVLHRDLKPHNVILRTDGQPVLLDFGIARQQDAESLTQSGALVGTPAYMSPEQAEGKGVVPLDERADVYGLGATLYSLLCGVAPFEGSPVQILAGVLQHDPEWPDEVAPDLLSILRRAMRKDVGERYPSAAALREDLDRFLRGEPVDGAPRSPPRALLAGLALVALGTLSVLAWLVLRADPADPISAPLEIVLEAPVDGALVHSRQVTVRGRVEGDVEGARLSVAEHTRYVRRGEVFNLQVELERGRQRLELRAEHRTSGQSATHSLTLTCQPDPPWFYALAAAERPPLPLPAGVQCGDDPGTYVNGRDASVLLWVPPGSFRMGSEQDDVRPVHTVRFERGFFVGRTEVTWRQYRAFCGATGHEEPRLPSGEDLPGDDHPVSFVSWRDAAAYCDWAGLRLPTEAEWAYAARGPKSQRYPCSSEPPGIETANLFGGGDGYSGSSPVGAFPADRSPFGCLDMTGNVQEWTADWFVHFGYGDGSERVDPRGPERDVDGRGVKLVRGGSFNRNSSRAYAADRIERRVDEATRDLGFRVAHH